MRIVRDGEERGAARWKIEVLGELSWVTRVSRVSDSQVEAAMPGGGNISGQHKPAEPAKPALPRVPLTRRVTPAANKGDAIYRAMRAQAAEARRKATFRPGVPV